MRGQQKSLAQKIRSFLRGYKGQYFEYLYYQHRFVNMKGITSQGIFNLEQPEVYVDVNLALANPDEFMTGIVSLPKREYENYERIWAYLGKKAGPGNKLVIVGTPGSGKTTLLKQVVLEFCKFRSIHQLPGKVPILLFLRNHVSEIVAIPDIRLIELLRDSLSKAGIDCRDKWFERNLKKGQCVILLDGLDEIGDNEYRKKVVKWVEKQFLLYPKNDFILTSRPYGITDLVVKGAEILQILPLEMAHIEKFIQDWYWATERKLSQSDDVGVRSMANEGAQDLLSRIQNTEALHPLARNALLLTMIATLHRFDAQLPGRRVELYDAIFQIFFRRRELLGISLLTSEQSKTVLLPLARFMMEKCRREISLEDAINLIKKDLAEIGGENIQPVDFLRAIQNQSGLLLEVAENEFSFASLTFQEYLASVYYVEIQNSEFLTGQIKDGWWWETIRLFCAQTDGTRIIEACLADDPIDLEQLQLAISCLEEALRVEVGVRGKLNSIIRQGVDYAEPRWRNVIAAALLVKRLRFMDRIDARRLIDNSLVTNVEYQIFLDHEAEKGHYYYPDHWTECKFPEGKALEPVTGVRISDVEKLCGWLVPQDIWQFRYRLPGAKETTIHKCDTDTCQYWLSDGGVVKLSTAKKDISPRYKDLIIQQAVNDSEMFTAIRAAAERERTAKSMEELLESVPPVDGRTTRSSFDLTSETRAAEVQRGETQRNVERHLWETFYKFTVCLGLDARQFLESSVGTVTITHKDQVQAFDWMPVFPYPPEYGFDIGKEILDFGNQYPEVRLRVMLGKKFEVVVHAHKLASTAILERSWGQLIQAGSDRQETYGFVRDTARMSLLALAFAGRTKHPSLSRDIANMYLMYCLLERRIAGKETPVEGVRLVKFS